MGWSGGTFTRTNGTYSGATVWESDEANGFDIDSDRHDNHDQDIASGINNCLNKNGQNAMTANLAMGGNKVTGMADGTAPTDAVTKSQLDSKIPDGTTITNLLAWNGSAYVSTPFAAYLPNGTSSGDVATWNGTNWTAQAPGGGGSLPAGVTTNSALRWSGSAWVETDALLIDGSDGWAIGPNGISGSVGGTITSTSDSIWMGGDSVTNGFYFDTNASAVTIRAAARTSTGTANNRIDYDAEGHRFETNGTERIRVNTSGRTEVGGDFGNDTVRLRVKGTGSDDAIFQAVDSGGTLSSIDCRDDRLYSPAASADTTGSGANVFINNASTPAGRIQRSTSSLRYKDNVRDYPSGLDALMTLRSVLFEDKNNPGVDLAGFIAEEVHEAGLTEFVVYDSEGRPDALHYANMLALVVKAVQELAER